MRLFVNNLTNIDFSYLHPTRGLVGETWLASVELQGDLDEQGMVVDFGIVKKTLRNWLDTHLDHCLLVPELNSSLTVISKNPSSSLKWSLANGTITCESPKCAITFVGADEITPTKVAQWCKEQLANEFPDTVVNLTLDFAHEVIDAPYYHYSHGLKKHNGNCQRIAHGHRSRINIWLDGQLNGEETQKWSRQWQDIYIGTREDLCQNERAEHTAFQYTSEQGKFYLEVPSYSCYIIDTDTTVELIAHHIASKIKSQRPQNSVKVQAFEGLGKGAIVEIA